MSTGAAGAEDIFADIDPDTKVAVKAETKLANEVFIPEKLVIPGGENGGYLVLAVGTAAQHGIQDSPVKLVDKKIASQLLYNIKSEFALPYPGNDLMTFFRNGGTIQLYHRDIAANAAKLADKADANGYKATATPHAADSVVISEIMWGSDASLGGADAAKSQWIELYNPGADAISIDKYEWVLAFSAGAGTGQYDFRSYFD